MPSVQHCSVVRGQLLRRYKRFLADVSLNQDPSCSGTHKNSESTTVFFPNTGPLPGLLDRCTTMHASNANWSGFSSCSRETPTITCEHDRAYCCNAAEANTCMAQVCIGVQDAQCSSHHCGAGPIHLQSLASTARLRGSMHTPSR